MSIRNGWPAVSGAADQFDIRAALRATTAQDANGTIKTGTTPTSQSLDRLVTARQDMAVDLHPSDWVLDRQGPIYLCVDGTETIPLDPAPSANSRIDTIWIKQQETQSPIGDTTDGPTTGKTTGTPGITPTPPTIPEGALAIADVLVPSTATNTSSPGVIITQRYPFTAAQGAQLTFRDTGDLNSHTPYDGQRARTISDDAEYIGKSGVWVSQTHMVQWKPPYTDGRLWLTRVGSLCMLSGNVKFSQGVDANYAKAKETLPMGFRPVDVNTAIAIFGGDCTFILYADATGAVTMLGNPNSAYAGCTGAWRTLDPMPAT